MFRSSGKIALAIEHLNKYFKGSHNSPKQIYDIKTDPHHGLTFIYFSEKKASFSSLIDNS